MAESQQNLSIEVKRQVVYASLLRFEGAAQHLRDRVVDRLVLGALSDSDQSHAVKPGDIAKRVSIGKAQVRVETIHDSLKRLEAAGLVEDTRVRLKRAFYLSERGRAEVGSAVAASSKLLDDVLAKLTKDLPSELDRANAETVFRRFFAECFARLGLEIAKTVTGLIDRADLVRMPQVIAAFNAACAGETFPPHVTESLQARCSEFLRSTHPEDERLKLYLTQAYFFTQLIGIQGAGFDPLAEQAFAGARLYLDTNTLLPRLLQGDSGNSFGELITVAKELGVDILVTRATLNEVRRVAADREKQLRTIIAKGVPDELMHRADDQFTVEFVERRDRDGITIEQFFEPFEHITDFIQKDLAIPIVEVTEEEVLAGRSSTERVTTAVQQESEAIRKRRKTQRTLDHDVAHLCLVEDDRRKSPKTWFLTSDRSLIEASAQLAGDKGSPSCFSLTGFLQTLSPFLTTSGAATSLADVFSSILSDQVGPAENTYDMEELVVLADMHEDVLATRDERLVQAIDAVRRRALNGRRFRADNAQRAALEFKKFLGSGVAERERLAAGERDRLRGEVDQTRQELDGRQLELRSLRDELEQVQAQMRSLSSDGAAKDVALNELRVSLASSNRASQRNRAILAAAVGTAIAWSDDRIAGAIYSRVPELPLQGWLAFDLE